MSHEDIIESADKIGLSLSERLRNEKKLPVFVCVMKGAVNWMVDLMEHVDVPIKTDYIQISSYSGTSSTGKITLKKDISHNLEDRVVVIVEDVVDTGISMQWLIDYVKANYHPKEVIVAVLFDKRACRKVPVHIDYAGKVLDENKFLVGYGLDYRGLGRNVPYVYVPTPEEVAAWDKQLAER